MNNFGGHWALKLIGKIGPKVYSGTIIFLIILLPIRTVYLLAFPKNGIVIVITRVITISLLKKI